MGSIDVVLCLDVGGLFGIRLEMEGCERELTTDDIEKIRGDFSRKYKGRTVTLISESKYHELYGDDN